MARSSSPSSDVTAACSSKRAVGARPGERANRRLAAAFQDLDDDALGQHLGPRRGVVERRQARGERGGRVARRSTPTAPCPGAGTQAVSGSASEMRSAKPTRSSPAHASTMAS